MTIAMRHRTSITFARLMSSSLGLSSSISEGPVTSAYSAPVREGYFLLGSHPHKRRLSPESYRCHSKEVQRSGGLGVGSKMGTGSRLRHIERRGDPMSRARSRIVMHTTYDGCACASAQYCSVSRNILTGNILERIESLLCRVPATTVAGSQQGSPVGHCPVQHENGSQRLRRLGGRSGGRQNAKRRHSVEDRSIANGFWGRSVLKLIFETQVSPRNVRFAVSLSDTFPRRFFLPT
jgi:hypothetical protein